MDASYVSDRRFCTRYSQVMDDSCVSGGCLVNIQLSEICSISINKVAFLDIELSVLMFIYIIPDSFI